MSAMFKIHTKTLDLKESRENHVLDFESNINKDIAEGKWTLGGPMICVPGDGNRYPMLIQSLISHN